MERVKIKQHKKFTNNTKSSTQRNVFSSFPEFTVVIV